MKLIHWPLMGGLFTCYIWYSEEGPGRAAPTSPLLAVRNETAHPSTASVSITVLVYTVPLICGFNVSIKRLITFALVSTSYFKRFQTGRRLGSGGYLRGILGRGLYPEELSPGRGVNSRIGEFTCNSHAHVALPLHGQTRQTDTPINNDEHTACAIANVYNTVHHDDRVNFESRIL